MWLRLGSPSSHVRTRGGYAGAPGGYRHIRAADVRPHGHTRTHGYVSVGAHSYRNTNADTGADTDTGAHPYPRAHAGVSNHLR